MIFAEKNIHFVLLCTAVLSLHVALLEAHVRGVSPNLESAYAGSKFTCFDNSRKIDKLQVNDNYCDCADGSDEPGTAACPNGQFYCVNASFKPRILNSSFVDDGICDCCDGSDESATICPSVCDRMGSQLWLELKDRHDAIVAGLSSREILKTDSIKKKEALLLRTAQLHKDKLKFESKIFKLKAKVDKIKLDPQLEALENSTRDIATDTLEMAAREEAVNDQQISQASEPTDLSPEEQARRVASQWTKDPEAMGVSKKHADDVSAKSSTPKHHSPISALSRLSEWWRYIKNLGDSPQTIEELHTGITEWSNKLEEVLTEIKLIENQFKGNLGPNSILLSMTERCYKSVSKERYEYEICPFKTASQIVAGSLEKYDLGTWLEFNEKSKIMHFKNGAKCWNGPHRSIAVNLQCGTSEFLDKVTETNRCEYAAVLYTPIACDLEDLNLIKNEMNGLKSNTI